MAGQGRPMKSVEKRRFWKNQIETWQASELSQAAYCQQHQLKLSTFTYWRTKFKDSSPSQLRLVPLVARSTEGMSQKKNRAICLCHGEFTIKLDEDFNPKTLRQLLEILS